MRDQTYKPPFLALGPRGTFGHEAARWFLDSHPEMEDLSIQCLDTNNQTLMEKILSHARYGIVPVMNSISGPIMQVLSVLALPRVRAYHPLLIESTIIGEVILDVNQNLLVHPSVTSIDELRGVMSHSHALAQCRESLGTLGIKKQIETPSTAAGAQMVAENLEYRLFGAIGSCFAAETYGLTVFKKDIHDISQNNTRFLVFGSQTPEPTGYDKTALTFMIPDEPGALAKVSGLPWMLGVNISTVPQMIPIGRDHLYSVYMEVDVHQDEEKGEVLFRALKLVTENFRILGSFPRFVRNKK